MIGQTISHYRILEKLGEGGMGIVYKAQDTSLDRIVALKFLPQHLTSDQAEQERFVHEARAASSLNHPNITTIHEISVVDGKMFIVMEYCEGRTLRQLIESENLSVKKVLDISIQACEGLALAHEKGIVHRDIKSDNIMVTPRNQVKIMDFGLAKLKGASKLTRTGSTLGTASYMSPEQAQGEDVDRRSDIFSFGIVLYEMLTRQLPFRGEHQSAVTYSIINEEPQPIARFNNQVSPRLQEVVSKALSKDRDERYQHIDDLLADLRRERKSLEYVRAGQVTQEIPVQVAPSNTHSGILKYVVPAAAAIVLVVLVIIFNPFNLQIGQPRSVAAEQNSVAVMYFENIPDPEDKDHTGEMLANLLITSLSQAKGLDVISRERLYDIQKDLGQGGLKSISPSLATQIAGRAGVKTMLLGSIVQMSPSLVVTSRLVDVQSGKILGSERLGGFSSQKIFALVDTLATLVKADLNVSTANAAPGPSVAAVTTSSPEAYRSYIEAVELGDKFYYNEAEAAAKRAIELDNNFAMAYFFLGNVMNFLGDYRGATEALQTARELSNRVSERERLRIESTALYVLDHDTRKAAEIMERYVRTYPREPRAAIELSTLYDLQGDQERARAASERALAFSPEDKQLINQYAYILAGSGERAKALEWIDKYVALAPAEPNPYDSKGEIFFVIGNIDSALYLYRKALTMRGDYTSSEKIGFIDVTRGDYRGADEAFDRFGSTSSPIQKFTAELDRSIPLIHRGRFGDARHAIEALLKAPTTKALPPQQTSFAYSPLIFVCDEMGDHASALKYARLESDLDKLDKSNTIYDRDVVALELLRNGDTAASRTMMAQVERDTPESMVMEHAISSYMRGVLEFEAGDYQSALARFAATYELAFSIHAPEYFNSVALLKNGRISEAIAEFKRHTWWSPISYPPISLTGLPTMGYWPIASVKAHYWLGVAYEQQGNRNDAIKEYGIFLDIWKDAEKEWPEMADAKARLARLHQPG